MKKSCKRQVKQNLGLKNQYGKNSTTTWSNEKGMIIHSIAGVI